MAKKTDITKTLKAYNSTEEWTIKIGNLDLPIHIKKYLSPSDRIAFVNNVSDSIVVDGVRNFGIYDYAFKTAAVKMFTDFNVALNDQDMSALVYCTDICKVIYSAAGSVLLSELSDACMKQIKHAIDAENAVIAAFAKPDPLDRIATAIEDVTGGIKDVVGSMDIGDLRSILSATGGQAGNSNLIHGIFGKEDTNGAKDSAEQPDVAGADSVDQPGEHSSQE